jgi:DnaJ-domain-containing protein 1
MFGNFSKIATGVASTSLLIGVAVILVLFLSFDKIKPIFKRMQTAGAKRKSELYRELIKLNKQFKFNKFKDKYEIGEVFSSRRTFESVSTTDVFLNFVKKSSKYVEDLLFCIEQNREIFSKYAEEYEKLGTKFLDPKNRRYKWDKRFYNEYQLRPSVDVVVLVRCVYFDEYEHVRRENYTEFNCEDIENGYYYITGKPRPERVETSGDDEAYRDAANVYAEAERLYREAERMREEAYRMRRGGADGGDSGEYRTNYNANANYEQQQWYSQKTAEQQTKTVHTELYDALGVSNTATADDIKAAYRKLAKEYHPDRNQGSADAERRFKEINCAYQVLSDPTRRSLYDLDGTT